MPFHANISLVLCAFAMVTSLAAPLHGQTIDDGLMVAGRTFLTGDFYARDSFDQYWEGTLKRRNGNIGTITTQTNVLTAVYGLTDRLNVMAGVPYVWTRASQGVLHGIEGLQDLSLAAKVSLFERPSQHGSLRAIGVVSAGIPLTNYNPELLPLSIGLGSTRVAWRGTVHFQSTPGWFFTGSTAYTWRSQVQIDRPYFYTDDEFVLSDQVDMPNVLDYLGSAGYMNGGLMLAVSFSQQQTLGGGDIRRQDMPFVSNRMNAFRVGAMAMYPVPGFRDVALQVALTQTFEGRNVGDARTVITGVRYTFSGGVR